MSTLLPVALTGSWVAAVGAGEQIRAGMLETTPGTCCALCGHTFRPGEKGHVNPTSTSPKFNDAASMKGPPGGPICDACAVVIGTRFLQNLSKSVISLAGTWQIASNNDLAYFLLDPPKPPFVAVWSLTKQAHQFWRTPVAYSREVFPIRVGPHVGHIRRNLIFEAWRLGPHLLELSEQHRAMASPVRKTATKALSEKVRHRPFIRLDRNLVDPQHGQLKPVVRSFLALPDVPPEMRFFGELTAIECWALAALYNCTDVPESRPEPIAVPSHQFAARA